MARDYEWFELLVKDDRYREILNEDGEVKRKLSDKRYVRSLDLNLEEIRRFAELLQAKYSDMPAETQP
ncbi:hypothetical protein [Paenibacillus arenilitoris]|uniref:Uncharacterized protein n=1 Tax=Paenibacillus arenilitoris TaxID=2772299 RepID=A0A927CN82_9BACL|nr:hypothetical protein [Paenibacillus arenilitoris]MBD2871183.1 hypothetical protein [Paenibacillus arenilitoris]